jgi:hypothetical protein
MPCFGGAIILKTVDARLSRCWITCGETEAVFSKELDLGERLFECASCLLGERDEMLLGCLCDALSSITLRLALLLCVSYRCSNRVGIFCAHLIFLPRVCWGHEIGFSESVDPRAAVFAWSVLIALPPVQVSLL